jgi:hypothetical protein
MVHIFCPPAGFSGRIRTPLMALLLAAAVAGCASVPPPDDSMNRAQSQLQAARDAGAADYAPVDLGFAQDKFQQAQGAMMARKYADASALADESRADAELAQAKARLGAARAQIQSKVQQNDQLREEGQQAASQHDATAPADPGNSGLPPATPNQDMPAPDESILGPAPTDGGLQTVPSDDQPASSSSSQDGQP